MTAWRKAGSRDARDPHSTRLHALTRAATSAWLFAIFVALFSAAPLTAHATVPSSAVELPAERTQSAKHYALPGGQHLAVIGGTPLHFQDTSGVWQDIELAFHREPDGDDFADRNASVVRSDAWGLTLSDWWGRGVLWLTPARPQVSGDAASVASEGVVWTYKLTPTALKAEALVSSSRGPQLYRFLNYTIGGTVFGCAPSRASEQETENGPIGRER